jgi:signal transduction histidine kinase
MTTKENLFFKISSALKDIIGRDLITDDFIAIFELVKNSVDAKASKIEIIFPSDDKIIISDNGKGMSHDDLLEKWLFVAYSAKKEGIEDGDHSSPQSYAGEKGIGRFSCDRLGKKLLLTTKRHEDKFCQQMTVNWELFEKDSKIDFIKVPVTLEDGIKPLPAFSKGTYLEISGLRSEWPREKLQELKHSLEKLMNPLDPESGKPFRIFIRADHEREQDKHENRQRDKVNGEVQNFVFEMLDVKTTQITCEIDSKGKSITTQLTDRGTVIYKIEEKNLYPQLFDIKTTLFYLNRAAKTNFVKMMGTPSVRFGSVFLYKNGFRVYPFGEEKQDKLGIERRHQQGTKRYLGTRDLFGRIELLGENPDFRETSSRDGGFIETDAYLQLCDFFMTKCLLRLERYVVDVQWPIKPDKDSDDISLLNNPNAKTIILDIIGKLTDAVGVNLIFYNKDFLNIIKGKADELETNHFEVLKIFAKKADDPILYKRVVTAEKDYIKAKRLAEDELNLREKKEQELEIEKQKNTFLLETSKDASPDTLGLVHNIKISTQSISAEIEILVRKIKANQYNRDDFLKRLSAIKISSDKSLQIAKLITRSNFNAEANIHLINLPAFIDQYISAYNDFHDEKPSIALKGNKIEFWAKLSILDLTITLDNLISNAMKSGAKHIIIQFQKEKKSHCSLLFSDDGSGLRKTFLKDPEVIFQLGVSDTDGSGIGLYISRKLLQKMGAELHFSGNNILLKGACFKISFN